MLYYNKFKNMYTAYIYDHNNNLLTQVFDLTKISIYEKINDINTCSFILSSKKPKYEYFREFNIIKIVKQEKNGVEKKLFEGIIKIVDINFNFLKIELNSYEYILKRRNLYNDKNYQNKTIDYIINDLVGGFGFNIDCGETKTISVNFKKGRNILSCLKDLISFGFDFKFLGKTLIFKENIGIDRTFGGNLVEFIFDKNDIYGKNIASIKNLYNADYLANYVFDKNGFAKDDNSIGIFGQIDKYINSGDINEELENLKNGNKELEIVPIVNDYFLVDIGDIVKINLFLDNELIDYIGDIKVIGKRYNSGNNEKIEIILNKTKYKTPTILEKIKQLNEKVESLEL